MPKVVAAFVRAEVLETGTEERPERLAAATACGANEGLELREAELDGIEVRAIGWQVPEGGPGGLDGLCCMNRTWPAMILTQLLVTA